MNITLSGTKVSMDGHTLAFQKNNLVDSMVITVDTDETWQYKLDVKYPCKDSKGEQLYNVIDLTRVGNTCTAILQAAMLPFNGKYTMQLRGISGDKVYHTDTFDVWVKYSIDPGKVYDPVPSEFYQIESNITSMNNHPPKSGDNGYWLVWNVAKQEYEESDIPLPEGTLPEVSDSTNGWYLTNDGERVYWADVQGGSGEGDIAAIQVNGINQPIVDKVAKLTITAKDVGAISQDDLQEATNEALAQAKASGEFDGPAGSDATVTAENIQSALGYTPADSADVSAKLDKPATPPEVGKILKVTAVNEDGTFTCEWADNNGGVVDDVQVDGTSVVADGVANIPLAKIGSTGVVKFDAFMPFTFNAGALRLANADENELTNPRYGFSTNRVITAANYRLAVKLAMCDGIDAAWTDAEKTGAWKRLNSIKTTMDDIAVAGSQYYLGEKTAVSVVLPDDAEVGQMVTVSWYNGATAATLSITGTMLAFDYTPSANTRSEINALWDGTYWAVLGNEMEVPNDVA